MSTYNEEKTIIRRYLRDPDANIWSDADILAYWNDAQKEVFAKIGYIERAHSYKYPPEWTFSYMRDWEKQHTEGDQFQCLELWQARKVTICYPWEAVYFLTNSNTADGGHRFVHPWESQNITIADYVPIPLHADFYSSKFVAYDERPLQGIDRKSLAEMDPWYKTKVGLPEFYWRPDAVSNQFAMYRHPSGPLRDDVNILSSPLDAFADEGGINLWTESDLDETNFGIIYDTVATDQQIFMVFESLPSDMGEDERDWDDELGFVAFLTKYVRYATLERCYGADTDGFIPTLRDYWNARKTIGIKIMKKYKAMRSTARDYQFAGGVRHRGARSRLKLPPEYPSTNP